jgi:hypothetical protein
VRVPSPEGAVLLSSDIPKQTWLPSISRPRSRQYLRLNIAAAGGGPGSKFRACAMVGLYLCQILPFAGLGRRCRIDILRGDETPLHTGALKLPSQAEGPGDIRYVEHPSKRAAMVAGLF